MPTVAASSDGQTMSAIKIVGSDRCATAVTLLWAAVSDAAAGTIPLAPGPCSRARMPLGARCSAACRCFGRGQRTEIPIRKRWSILVHDCVKVVA
jgi:hypothetical protein